MRANHLHSPEPNKMDRRESPQSTRQQFNFDGLSNSAFSLCVLPYQSICERDERSDKTSRLANSLASIEKAPGPRNENDEAHNKTMITSITFSVRRCRRSINATSVAARQTTGVNIPRQSITRGTMKATCGHPVGNAIPAKAAAIQHRSTKRATPGAPAGNIEKSLCTPRA
jgi:hypothetical protein